MAFLLRRLHVEVTWDRLLRGTVREAFFHDNCLGMAAQLAYYFFFALFPTLLMVLAFASYFPVVRLIDDTVALLGGVAPREVIDIVTDQIRKISRGEQGGLLTIGMLTAMWSSSAAMTAIIDTINRAYDIDEGRAWWKVRLTAVVLTVGLSAFILVAAALVLLGPETAEYLAAVTGLGGVFEWTWKVLQWPIIFACVSTALGIVYYFGPDAEQDWVWLTPGSVLATALWIAGTLGFRYYLTNVDSYAESYGVVGSVMVLMLWFYISGLVILIGAELNAEIEHASPHGKEPGEKVPGQKRKIGAAAMRAWAARRHRQRPASAGDVREAIGEHEGGGVPPASPDPPGQSLRNRTRRTA